MYRYILLLFFCLLLLSACAAHKGARMYKTKPASGCHCGWAHP